MTKYSLPKSIIHRLVDLWGVTSVYDLRKFAEMNEIDWDFIVYEKDPNSTKCAAYAEAVVERSLNNDKQFLAILNECCTESDQIITDINKEFSSYGLIIEEENGPLVINELQKSDSTKKGKPTSSILQKTSLKHLSTNEISDLISLLDKSLRKILDEKPKNEHDVHKSVKKLFTGTQFEGRYDYESVTVTYSSKHYIPDFVFKDVKTVVEIKFCDSHDDEKKFISQINDDILAYKKDYDNIIFVVYDLGFINDTDRFKKNIEDVPGVTVLVIKH